jgi:tRNA (mo5U34)-methyltransferase
LKNGRYSIALISFVEHSYSGDPTNWFFPNRAAVEAMLRSAGFVVEAHPKREVYLCRRGEHGNCVDPPLRTHANWPIED